ncbi:MAG: RluA family pseudouridine synthase [Saezia sp.]
MKMETIVAHEDVSDEQVPEAEVRYTTVGMNQHKQRLDLVLVDLAPEFSRSYLQKLIADGAVQLNEAVVTKSATRVQVRQRIVIELRPTPDALAFRAEEMALDIVYEDEHLMVLNKPAGLVVHPGAGNWSGTLLNGLLGYHEGAKYLPRAGIVHRLDKDTSGLMIVGKTLQTCTALVEMISTRSVKREYKAMVHGVWPEQDRHRERLIDAPVGRDLKTRVKMATHAAGKVAQTSVQFLAAGEGCSLLLCRLHTGRTHQIRVHMSSIGYPLVGDVLYGGKITYNMSRQALHAFRLSFVHPMTGKDLVFMQDFPADLSDAVKMARLDCHLA